MKKEIYFYKGAIITLFGFVLYCITSIIYAKPPFDYYSKPNVWFIISIVIMVYGMYMWFKRIKEIK